MSNHVHTSKCHKKPGEPCKLHNPVVSVASAEERVDELFSENYAPKRNYDSVKTALNNVTKNRKIINRYIPQDNDARFGTKFIPRTSRLGATYLGLIEKARTGEHIADLKEEYRNALREAEHELNSLEEAYEMGSADDTRFRGALLKIQMYHSAVLTAKDTTIAYRPDRYSVKYSNDIESFETQAPTLEAAHKASDALRSSLTKPAVEGKMSRIEGSREDTVGEMWDDSGRYTYCLSLKGNEWYIPLIRLKD